MPDRAGIESISEWFSGHAVRVFLVVGRVGRVHNSIACKIQFLMMISTHVEMMGSDQSHIVWVM